MSPTTANRLGNSKTNTTRPKRVTRNDLTSKLASVCANKRVAVYIDAANLYYSASRKGLFINFESIKDWFSEHSTSAQLYFYTAFDPEDEKQMEFMEKMDKIGYHIIKKPIKVFNNLTKGNMDIELTVDSLLMASEYDVMVLISGDGDFSYLLQALEKMHKGTSVIGVGGFTSYELHQQADNYFFLDRIASVWRSKTRDRKHEYIIFLDQISDDDWNTGDKNAPKGTDSDTSKSSRIQASDFSAPEKKSITKSSDIGTTQPNRRQTPHTQTTRTQQTRTVNKAGPESNHKRVKVKLHKKVLPQNIANNNKPSVFID